MEKSSPFLPSIRSCPCSPKNPARHRNYSPELPLSRSPTSNSTSKFSLSGSLWALHRQASNSLRGEFSHQKLESGNKTDPGTSLFKARSLQNSIKVKKRRSHFHLDEEENSSVISEEDTVEDVNEQNPYGKKPICESISLPTLKLSRMALTYRGGVITKNDKGIDLLVPEEDSGPEIQEVTVGACALPETSPIGECASSLLPDLIPVPQREWSRPPKVQPPVAAVSPFYFSSQEGGVINLGFDGQDESSDFTANDSSVSPSLERNVEIERRTELIQSTPKIHGLSMGYLSSAKSTVTGLDVPAKNTVNFTQDSNDIITINNVTFTTQSGDSANHNNNQMSVPPAVVISDTATNMSTACSTIQCSPSALRIRVMDENETPVSLLNNMQEVQKSRSSNQNPSQYRLKKRDKQKYISHHHQQPPPNILMSGADNPPKSTIQRVDSFAVVPVDAESAQGHENLSSGTFPPRRSIPTADGSAPAVDEQPPAEEVRYLICNIRVFFYIFSS